MARYVGVDLGATNVRAVVGDRTGAVVGRASAPTPQGPSGIAVANGVVDAVRDACAAADVRPEGVSSIGVGAIGLLNRAAGTFESPANLDDDVDAVPVVGPLTELCDAEVHLHNDTVAGVIGERFFGERTPDDMVYLTVSSGIGAGVAVDGNVLTGWNGNAGEVGHTIVDPDGTMTCGCGCTGHWEAYCSGNNIPRYARHLHDGEPTSLSIDDPDLSAADVFDHVPEDDFAGRVIERVGRWNAVGVANVVAAFAPQVVSVGGAVTTNNPELLLGPLREQLPELTLFDAPDVELTTLGEDVVVKGALASAMTAGTGDRSRLRT